MASQYQTEQDPYNGYFQEQPPPPQRSIVLPIVFLVIFIIALILLVIFIIYWFGGFRPPPPWVVNCKVNTDCFPGNVCNTDKGVCEVVPCMKQSDCDGVPGSFCIRNNDAKNKSPGYCELPACSQNSDCNEDEACINYDALDNWGSVCVKVGISCETTDNCYGGSQQDRTNNLLCSNKKCVQCTQNSHCSETNYCNVEKGLCTNCIEGVDNPGCDRCGSDGVCCRDGFGPYYGGRCKIGDEYDYCDNDLQCGVLGGNVQMVCKPVFKDNASKKVCMRPTNGCLFSKNTLFNDKNNFIDGLVCNDLDRPFCDQAGTCVSTSVVNSKANTTQGSVCGAPSKCSNSNYTGTSILCDSNLTFNNPYQPFCDIDNDCVKYGIAGACINGLCEKTCDSVDKCLVGQVCGGENSNKTEDCTDKDCYCQYPTTTVICDKNKDDPAFVCPRSFSCVPNGSIDECNFSTSGGGSYPAVSIVNNYCSTPANKLNSLQIANSRGAFCVGGACLPRPGWMGNNCELNKDCMFIDGDTIIGQTSFICSLPNSNGMSICKVPS